MLTWTAIVHAIAGILILGYGMEYYFHLREYPATPKKISPWCSR